MWEPSAFAGKNILVTGAGGFIGSALVKALAAANPAALTLLDLSEHNLFQLRRALQADFPRLSSQAVVGSVTDATLLDCLFGPQPQHYVFHAAAFKHVELMELNPFAAVLNNAVGTFCLIKAALRAGCESLVLVSTDKAVRPHSMMGVSKRIAELNTVSMSRPDCRMNAVRLCNISGSSGSVIPVFLDQLANGKALTLTHPNASRYFLSTDDAVAAILAAATDPSEGRILLPTFGPAVRIADLAHHLSAGRSQPPFEIIGLRPGEKLTEDLIAPNEVPEPRAPGPFTVLHAPRLRPGECERFNQKLVNCLSERNASDLLDTIMAIVPDYTPSLLIANLANSAAPVS